MAAIRPTRACWLAVGLAAASLCHGQSTGRTVRHHTETEPVSPSAAQLAQAEAAIEKRDYAAAEPLLQQVVAQDASSYQAWFDLGFVYHALGRDPESIEAYRKSVEAKPDVFESNLNLGLSLAKSGQADAERYLRAATTLTPTARVEQGRARAWLALARVLEPSRPLDAVEAYRHAAELTPRDPEPLLAMGPLLERENRFSDALEAYHKVLALDPASSDALTGMANVYMRGRQFSDAADALRKLVALHPQDAAAHLQLGRVLAAGGDNDPAIAELRQAIALAPGDASAQRDLADLLASAGKLADAEAAYKGLLARDPRDAESHRGLGVMLLKQRRYPEAQQELLAAVQIKPDFAAAYGDLAAAASENKNYELAIRALDTRARYLPEPPVGYFLRATAYDHLRDYKRAAENYHRFLDTANGQFPDQEWQARHRLIAIEPKKR